QGSPLSDRSMVQRSVSEAQQRLGNPRKNCAPPDGSVVVVLGVVVVVVIATFTTAEAIPIRGASWFGSPSNASTVIVSVPMPVALAVYVTVVRVLVNESTWPERPSAMWPTVAVFFHR